MKGQVGRSALLERQTQLGDAFLPYAIVLVIGAEAVAALRFVKARSERKRYAKAGGFQDVPTRQAPRWMVIAVVVLALLTSAKVGYQTFRVGDSGSAAAWSEFSTR